VSQARRNENRFYRYPMRRVSAIIDDVDRLEVALDALSQTGVDLSKVHVLTGPEGARLLDRSGTGHGLWARLLRRAQWGAYEGNALEAHERALKSGHNVIFVPARSDEQLSRIVKVLRNAGGYHLLHFRPWSIEMLP
jgi:hypothetical protein